MNPILAAWNHVNPAIAADQLIHCCAARRWATEMAEQRPFSREPTLLAAADEVWATMREPDWMQAFQAHPRIGERNAAATERSKTWSSQEQQSAQDAGDELKERMAAANRRYEELFGFTYIVCATGKSLQEMLGLLESRLRHDRETELAVAAEQQRQITQIRLRKWLNHE